MWTQQEEAIAGFPQAKTQAILGLFHHKIRGILLRHRVWYSLLTQSWQSAAAAGPVLGLASGDSSNSPNGGRQVNLCNIVVNPNVNGNNGIVYIVWAHLRGNPGSPSSESIEMSRSFDNGQTVDGVQILTYF